MNETIQSLWIGPRLTAMERLCIASFLRQGHPFHLYAYDDIEGVPDGAVVADATEILPADRIFTYSGNGSYSGFSNVFRYTLLRDRGGWWVDTDMVCLHPFRFEGDHVFSSESDGRGGEVVNCGAIRAPIGSAAMQRAVEVCESRAPETLRWGEIGPKLVRRVVEEFHLEDCVTPPAIFCPIFFRDWQSLLDPADDASPGAGFGPSTVAVHLWNEMWRREGLDKDGAFPPSCLYETLKRRILET